VDLKNFGATALTIRFEFENPFAGGDDAVTNTGFTLPAGSDWMHALFPVGLTELTALDGTVAGALANTSVLRMIHAAGLNEAESIAGQIAVDNITALGAIRAVPEPGTLYLSAAGLMFGALAWKRARKAT
jgi:hypothetical protein